jgi:hypothetical protein
MDAFTSQLDQRPLFLGEMSSSSYLPYFPSWLRLEGLRLTELESPDFQKGLKDMESGTRYDVRSRS